MKEQYLPDNTFELRISSQPRLLRMVRTVAGQMCELAGMVERDVHDVVLAVDEACTNIIRHSYDGQADMPIEIRFRILPEGLEISLRDFGTKIDAKKLRESARRDAYPRNHKGLRPGGLGLRFIGQIFDHVHYDTSLQEGTRLTLLKNRHSRETSGETESEEDK